MSAKAKNKLTPQQRKATLNRVLHKIRPYSAFVVCSLLVAAVSVAAQLYIPILCGDAIDLMLGKGDVDFAGVLRIVYEIVAVAVTAAFAQWLLSVCNNRITFSVSRDLRNAAMRKIQTLPLSYLDSHPSGDIVSRMVADVDTFADGLLMGFTQLFSGVLTILGTLLFMLSENVPITLVVVCITPLSLVVASFLAKRSYKYFQGQSTVRGEQTALVNEMIEGQKVVQAFGHEAESLTAFDEVNGRLQDVSLKAIFFSSMTNPATRFVYYIVYAGVGLVGALYAVRGGITIGQLSVFLSYANQYTKPFNEISGVVTELQNALACAARLLLVAVVGLRDLGDGFAVGNLRRDVFIGEFVLLLDARAQDVQVVFALTLDDGLLQLFGVFDLNGRVFEFGVVEHLAQLLLGALLLGLVGGAVARFGDYDRFDGHRRRRRRERDVREQAQKI